VDDARRGDLNDADRLPWHFIREGAGELVRHDAARPRLVLRVLASADAGDEWLALGRAPDLLEPLRQAFEIECQREAGSAGSSSLGSCTAPLR
jgi:hypothetical protein